MIEIGPNLKDAIGFVALMSLFAFAVHATQNYFVKADR